MTETQGWIVIILLAVIATGLYPLTKQIERFIRVVVHQRELLVQALTHFDDDSLRFELKVFLEEANKPAHEATRRSLEERGLTLPDR